MPIRILILGVAAGGTALLAPALAVVPAAVAALLFLLARPLAWVPILVALCLLVPPVPLVLGGVELPLHPAMIVCAGALLVAWARIREWRLEPGGLLAASFAFLATLLISLPLVFLYSGAAVGAQSAIRWLLLCLGFLVLAWTAWGPGAREGFETLLLKVVLVTAFFSALFAVADFFYEFPRTVRFSEQYMYLPDGPRRRAQGVFYDSGALGTFCAMMLVLIAALGADARRRLRIPGWLLWAPVPPLAVALLLSFSRASMLSLAAGLMVVAWMRRKTLLSARPALAGVALACSAALAIGLVAPEIASRYARRLEFTALEFFTDPNLVLSRRLDSWSFLGSFLRDNPQHLLLGIGYKSLPYTDYLGRPLVADNMYLSVLVEAGVPGLLALLVLCGALLARSWRLSLHSDSGVAALGVFLFAFWCGQMAQMLSGDVLTYWRVTPVYFAILGAAIRVESV